MNSPAGPAAPPGMTGAGSLQSVVPILLFLGVNRIAGLRWAVVVATIWSIKIIVDRRRKGLPLGRFMPIVTAAVIVRGAIGAITGSETVYFGLGIATKYVAAAALVGSILINRPLAERGIDFLLDLPAQARQHPTFRPTMAMITGLGALYYALSASFDVWLFQRSDVEGFVIWRFVANWPLSTAIILGAFALTQRRLQLIPDLPPVGAMIEQRFAPMLADLTVESPTEGPEGPEGETQ